VNAIRIDAGWTYRAVAKWGENVVAVGNFDFQMSEDAVAELKVALNQLS